MIKPHGCGRRCADSFGAGVEDVLGHILLKSGGGEALGEWESRGATPWRRARRRRSVQFTEDDERVRG